MLHAALFKGYPQLLQAVIIQGLEGKFAVIFARIVVGLRPRPVPHAAKLLLPYPPLLLILRLLLLSNRFSL